MNMKRIMIFLLATLLIVSFAYPQKFGRGKGRIRGYVIDEAGEPLEGASLVLTHEDKVTVFKTKSDKKGKWGFIGLGSGEFTIVTTLEGYIESTKLIAVRQLSRNPSIQIILKKPEKMVAKDNLGPKLKEAEKLYKEKKYDDALVIYKEVLEKAPEVYQMVFKIADCLSGKGEIKKAVAMYEKGIKTAVEKKDITSAAQALGIIGGMFLKKNDLKTAGVYFKRSIEMNPKDEILAYNVAEINFNNMKTDEAIKYYEMAIKIKPTWGPPYKQNGYAYLNKGDMKNAVKMFKKFLEIDPNSQDAAIIKQVIKSLPK